VYYESAKDLGFAFVDPTPLIVPVIPIVPSGKRMTNYVQDDIRSISFRAPFTPGVFVIGRPFTLVSAQTTALRPLVLQNEFTFGLNVKAPGRFNKKKKRLQNQ
jgi:hypothetical protein